MQSYMKVLFVISMLGMFAFFTLLKDLWVEVSQNSNTPAGAFIPKYLGQAIGGGIMYITLPALVLIFKGRSFKRYIASVFIFAPFMYYFTIRGALL